MANQTVLIIEDMAEEASALATLLEAQNFTCTIARTAAAARLAVQGRHFDIVLLDLTLPNGDGLALAEYFRANASATRLVAVSGRTTELDQRQSKQAGIDAHISKPIDLDRLLAVMN